MPASGCRTSAAALGIGLRARQEEQVRSNGGLPTRPLCRERTRCVSLELEPLPPYFLPPIPRLSVKDGLICVLCEEYCGGSIGTMGNHAQKAHGWRVKDGVVWEACKVPTFFRGVGLKRFIGFVCGCAPQGRSELALPGERNSFYFHWLGQNSPAGQLVRSATNFESPYSSGVGLGVVCNTQRMLWSKGEGLFCRIRSR